MKKITKPLKPSTYVILIVLVILLLLLARALNKSSGNNLKEEKNSQVSEQVSEVTEVTETTEEATSLENAYFHAVLHQEHNEKSKDGVLAYTEDVHYYEVQGENKVAVASINKVIEEYMDGVKADLNTWETNSLEACEETVKVEGKDNFTTYTFELSPKLLRNDEAIFSFILYSFSYQGGAHGSVLSHCMTFDAKTGKLLSLSDLRDENASLTKEEWEKQIVELVMEQCKEKEEELFEDYADYVEDCVLSEGSFALTAEGIQIVGDPYELAPYAAGMQVFTIETGDLKGFNQNYAFVQK